MKRNREMCIRDRDGVDESRAVACIGDVDDVELNGERFLDYGARCARQGLLPEQLAAVRLHRTTHPGQRQVNTTQRNGIDATCVRALYSSELEPVSYTHLLSGVF